MQSPVPCFGVEAVIQFVSEGSPVVTNAPEWFHQVEVVPLVLEVCHQVAMVVNAARLIINVFLLLSIRSFTHSSWPVRLR